MPVPGSRKPDWSKYPPCKVCFRTWDCRRLVTSYVRQQAVVYGWRNERIAGVYAPRYAYVELQVQRVDTFGWHWRELSRPHRGRRQRDKT